ncbi:MAG: Rpn family recombination-promoting nuclease/putative transposase [Anaerolinea sp.]|nr:Rpn family recombination-promoting nuclease/putative transposase [Anaerolinea sp.]
MGLRDGGEAYIYALLEHKSRPDPFTTFQLIRCMVRIWENDRREKRPLRPIFCYQRRSIQVIPIFITQITQVAHANRVNAS